MVLTTNKVKVAHMIPSVFSDLRNDPFLVGFDQIFDRILSSGITSGQAASYPPYNIVKASETDFRIELAVAGFKEEEIEITVLDDTLTIESNKDHSVSGDGETLIHQGIAERNFKRTWTLSPTVQVTGAMFEDGLLTVFLKNWSDKKKPQKIEINNGVDEGDSQLLNE